MREGPGSLSLGLRDSRAGDRSDWDAEADGGAIILKLSLDHLEVRLEMDLGFEGDRGRIEGDIGRDVSPNRVEVKGRTGDMAREVVERGDRMDVIVRGERIVAVEAGGIVAENEGMVGDLA